MKSQKLGFGLFFFSVKPSKNSKDDQKVEDNTAPEISPTVLYFTKNVVLYRQFYKPIFIFRNCLWDRLFLWLDIMTDRPHNANIHICLSVRLPVESKREIYIQKKHMSNFHKTTFFLHKWGNMNEGHRVFQSLILFISHFSSSQQTLSCEVQLPFNTCFYLFLDAFKSKPPLSLLLVAHTGGWWRWQVGSI